MFHSSGLTWSSQHLFSCVHKLYGDAVLNSRSSILFGACHELDAHLGRCAQPIFSRASLSPASGFAFCYWTVGGCRSNGETGAWTCATLLFWAKGVYSELSRLARLEERRVSIRATPNSAAIRLFPGRFQLAGCICLFKSFVFASSFSVMETQRNGFLHCTAGWEIYLVWWEGWRERLSCRLQEGWQLKRSWRAWKAPHDSSLRKWSEPRRSTYGLFAPF